MLQRMDADDISTSVIRHFFILLQYTGSEGVQSLAKNK
jgi:hypothetical protein